MIQRLSLRFARFSNAMMHVSRQNGVTAIRSAARTPLRMHQVAPLHVLRQLNPYRRPSGLLRQLHSTVSCSAAGDEPATDSWTNGVRRLFLSLARSTHALPPNCD